MFMNVQILCVRYEMRLCVAMCILYKGIYSYCPALLCILLVLRALCDFCVAQKVAVKKNTATIKHCIAR